MQSEAMIYGGMLLPTIAILEGNLHTVQNDEDFKCMKPIVTHTLDQIKKRFKIYRDDDDLYLATAFHPFFKLGAIRKMFNKEKLDHIQDRMVEILVKFAYEIEPEKGPTKEAIIADTNEITKKPKINYYDQLWDTPGDNIQEVIMYIHVYMMSYKLVVIIYFLNIYYVNKIYPLYIDFYFIFFQNNFRELQDQLLKFKLPTVERELNLYRCQLLIISQWNIELQGLKAFITYNTILPSSVSVERMFNMGSDILTRKRSNLNSDSMGKLVFLRGNAKYLGDLLK